VKQLGDAASEIDVEAIHLAHDAARAGLGRLRRKFRNT
jgi:hypothetical protein